MLKLSQTISYIFTSEAYDYLNQVPGDLREPTKKAEMLFTKIKL